MDLALELGQPAELLARTMTEREFQRWQKYARSRLLPTRRLEYYMAQIAQLIAITMGGAKDVGLQDYLIELRQEEVAEVVDLEAARKAFGYNPRRKEQ